MKAKLLNLNAWLPYVMDNYIKIGLNVNFKKETLLSFQPVSRGKCTPNYEVSYVVKENSFFCGTMTLATMDGDELASPINIDAVKKYFV